MPAHTLQHLPLTGGGLSRPGLWSRLRNLLARRDAATRAGVFSTMLGAGQELALRDAAGWTVACRSGSVWITQEADSRDNFLTAGERFTLDRDGLTLILAWKDSGLVIRSSAGGRNMTTESSQPDNVPATVPDTAREVWLRAVYPEGRPWNEPR